MPIPHLSERTKVATSSFQAVFYRIDDDRIAKVYGMGRVWGRIRFADPQVRASILDRELRCLQSLAAALEPALELVEAPHIGRGLALTMRCLSPTLFLESRLDRRETLTSQYFRTLARLILDFHFDPQVCFPADLGPQGLPGFLRSLLAQERDILLMLMHAKGQPISLLESLYQRIDEFIVGNTEPMLRFQEALKEPIVGHGDLKSQNIVFAEDSDTVYVVDSAPLREWRVNTRRMDAMLLDTELRLKGRVEEANFFWDEYDKLYRERTEEFVRNSKRILRTIESIDVVSRFYRANIFFRLALAGLNPELAEVSFKAMEQACDEF